MYVRKIAKRLLCSAALSGVFAIGLMPQSAAAQDADGDKGESKPEIVVTGTLVRGIAPAGASVLSTTSEDIQAVGATTTNEILQTIPQLGAFNNVLQPLAVSPEVAVNRPNLRALPGFNNAGGSTTLVMMDGHRIVGMGVASTTPDPDVIPPGVIARIEIVPDGGSAIYGSDAVAGVLNFITIDRFDGLKVDGAYGFADNYYRLNANVTGGIDWDTGSIFASYAYAKSDQLIGRDRDFIRQFPGPDGRISLECAPGNISALAGAFAPSGTVRGVNGGPVTQCDSSDFATVVPASERHSLYGGLTQDLSDKLTMKLRGFYTNRQTQIQNGPYRESRIIVPAFFAGTAQSLGIPAVTSPFNPWNFGGIVGGRPVFVPGSNNGVDLVQNVSFQFGPNDASGADIELDTWGISNEFAYDLDGNFQLRFLGNYGQSTTSLRTRTVNDVALDNAILAGLFNPFNPGSSNSAALGIISDFSEFGRTRQRFTNFRAIVDGDLFDIGAGPAKIAFGLEYYKEGFDSRRGEAVPGSEFSGSAARSVGTTLIAPVRAPVPRFNLSRDVKSAFGELIVPLVSSESGFGIRVSAAGRYDDYSDVGNTFNPRFGATLDVTDWFSIRGAWGTSFNAPSLADNENADVNELFTLVGSAAGFFAPPASLQAANGGPFPNYTGGLIMAIRGNAPGIVPQEAETWTVGFEMEPPIIPGLRLSATYYNISYDNFIGLAPFENPALLYRDFAFVIDTTLTQAELNAAVANADVFNGVPPTNPSTVYALFDARKRNFGGFKLDGIDWQANYRIKTGFGAIFFDTAGTYELGREQQNVPGGPFFDRLSVNANRLRARSSIGAEVGPFLAQMAWNFTQGYDVSPAVGFNPQNRVADFNVFDLFFKLDVPGGGIAKDLTLTLNVNNVFDADPPEFRGNIPVGGQQGVPANFLTIGRLVQFGISKKF